MITKSTEVNLRTATTCVDVREGPSARANHPPTPESRHFDQRTSDLELNINSIKTVLSIVVYLISDDYMPARATMIHLRLTDLMTIWCFTFRFLVFWDVVLEKDARNFLERTPYQYINGKGVNGEGDTDETTVLRARYQGKCRKFGTDSLGGQCRWFMSPRKTPKAVCGWTT